MGNGLAWIAAGLAVLAVVALGTVASLIVMSRNAPLPPQSGTTAVRPPEDYRRIREEESKMLEEYQWIDRDAGTVRIPIERAMKLIIERGSLDQPSSTQ
ncbi:MAG TPA: hypothetical protein VH702_00015, partial [Vicinamibacterales bacterium]